MTLPLPFRLGPNSDPDPEAIQANFDALAKRLPFSRKDLQLESPHNVGDLDEPEFQNGWVNWGPATEERARFWKDPVGVVHLEGLIKLGTIGSVPAFTLPSGYLPGHGLVFATISGGALARVDVAPTGEVMVLAGSSASYVSLSGISFRQEN